MLAHQGGWDEILFAAVPVAVIAVLLWVANSRAKKLGPPDAQAPATPRTPTTPATPESD